MSRFLMRRKASIDDARVHGHLQCHLNNASDRKGEAITRRVTCPLHTDDDAGTLKCADGAPLLVAWRVS